MEDIKNLINETLVDIVSNILPMLSTLICGLLAVYVDKLIKLAREKQNTIKGKEERELVANALNGLDELINSTVIALNETLVKEIKSISEDGKLTSDDISEIKTSLVELVNKQIAPNSKALIEKQIKDLDTYIDIKAEKYLLELKQNLKVNK